MSRPARRHARKPRYNGRSAMTAIASTLRSDMESTRLHDSLPHPSTLPLAGGGGTTDELTAHYRAILSGTDPGWAAGCRDLNLVGRGGQGVVFFARREGSDGFALPVALKVFSPEQFRTAEAYTEDMARIAAVAARVAAVQHENLVAVHHFSEHRGVRVMRMEWVDGIDLRLVLTPATLERTRARLGPEHLRFVEDVVLTDGPAQPRIKPGVATHILRDCLAALAALHREGITHGDLKPANVMLKRTGSAKVVDVGSAADLRSAEGRRAWSPLYAAPEVLDGAPVTPQSDLASLGYVLIEMMAGRSPFEGFVGVSGLIESKRTLEHRLADVLPHEVVGSDLLVSLCRRLVAADPEKRFPDAEAADLGRRGAAAFHRQLVKGDLASEYGNDLRVWLDALAGDGSSHG
ncbi:Serine/threonine-protein kinase PrkC [Gemmata obscuriglobus]|nr:Serine/threonine-protein kinase PrkC [Gemmata obscuriglobus]VTS10977.1 serine threonine protein kinase : Probable serine/threonine-protein kinase OS=Blastopirellula marina DSM 3645 GN=DSM3645_24837 PE=4 SV=1: Pkinase [Gemmata obscuriglobus UQM 2246]